VKVSSTVLRGERESNLPDLPDLLFLHREEINMSAVEVIFLERMDGHKVGSDFQGYYEYRYNTNPKKLLKTCMDKSLIEVAAIEHNIKKVKVIELKEVLRDKSLKVSGKKDELIARLLENVSKKDLEKYFTDKYYTLTESGRKYVLDNEYAIFYHKYQRLSDEVALKDFENTVNNNPDKSYYDISIELLTKALVQRRKESHWGLFRNVYLNMAGVHDWFDKTDLYVINSMMVCVIDLSGLSNNNRYTPNLILLAPGVIHPLSIKINNAGISEEEIKGIIAQCIEALDLPKSFFNANEVTKMIMLALNDYDKACEEIKISVDTNVDEDEIYKAITVANKKEVVQRKPRKKSLLSRIFGIK